jgi:hypothetical protein
MNRKHLLFLLLSFVPSIVFSQWSAATLSSPRTMLAAASANDVAIIAGGIGLISIPPPASDAYSAVTNNWTGNTLSQGRTWLSGTGAGNQIAFAGGANDWIFAIYDIVDIYNTTTSQWSTSNLTAARYKLAAAATAGSNYFCRGRG